jgi:hypothetical protein
MHNIVKNKMLSESKSSPKIQMFLYGTSTEKEERNKNKNLLVMKYLLYPGDGLDTV